MHRITLIGAGNMGSIILEKAYTYFDTRATTITVCDVNQDKLDTLQHQYPHIQITTSLEASVAKADLIILAIKPQHFDAACSALKTAPAHAHMLSIMAGVSTEKIASQTEHHAIIRTMPNTPMKFDKGVIGWYATKAVNSDIKERVIAFLSATGVTIACTEESDLNKITAISGSGPAYFFYAVNCLTAAAQDMGFSPEQSAELARQTMIGAAALLEETPDALLLQKQVTSKGGTTEAALQSMAAHHLPNIWKEATQAALKRAEEL